MRETLPDKIERCRVLAGYYGTTGTAGNRGLFRLQRPDGTTLRMLSSGSGDPAFAWEHVSVSVENKKRCPTWEEMCLVKDFFWDEEEVVMQLHPRKSEYVNCHPFVLHLWKPSDQVIPEPPAILVGPK